jgi:hypothetical protein
LEAGEICIETPDKSQTKKEIIMAKRPKPVVLTVLDAGFRGSKGNAIDLAREAELAMS